MSSGSPAHLIECPHCADGVELDGAAFGLFECPFCEEEFEWSRERHHAHEEWNEPFGFAIGAIVPFATTCLGVIYSIMAYDGLDALVGILSVSYTHLTLPTKA